MNQAPKLGVSSIAFICILTISAIVLPFIIVNNLTINNNWLITQLDSNHFQPAPTPIPPRPTPVPDSQKTHGRFPHASQRLLTASDLSGLSKRDLRIMRNEIYARHGYIFTTNDMRTHFQKQSWYRPRFRNVDSQLTNVERQNITLIQRYE